MVIWMPLPRTASEGLRFICGEVKNSFCWSLSWTYSSNSMKILRSVKSVV